MSTVTKESNNVEETVLQEPSNGSASCDLSSQGNHFPQPQRGIVSSENSVASSSTASSKLNAALAAAVAADAYALLRKPSDASDNKIKPVSEPSSSRPSTASNSPTDEEKKEEDDGDSPADNEAGPLSNSDANNALMLHMTAPPHHPVAEFLFQLTKMLTDNNSEFIEWKHSSILVHDPPGLEKLILPKYFRHSNYSSFQRQMNYFGFRKIAGKGKMAACSYVNEHAKEDISSLLYIKRKKTGVSGSAAKLLAQANKLNRVNMQDPSAAGGSGDMMMMNGMNQNNMMMNGMGGGMMGMNPNQMALMQQYQHQSNLMGGMGFQGMNGFQGMHGMGGMNSLQNMYSPKLGPSPGSGLNESSLLREQQSILAQLQQAHASASGGLSSGSTMGNNLSTPSSLMNGFGFPPNANSAAILTNDQGNLYSAASAANPEWSMANSGVGATNPQAQSLFMQQAAMGALGGFPQGAGGMGGMGDKANGSNRLDSAANLRSLINQQISLLQQDGTQAPMPSNGGLRPQAAMGMAGAGRMGFNPAMAGMSEQATNLPQGLSYEQFQSFQGGEAGQIFQRN